MLTDMKNLDPFTANFCERMGYKTENLTTDTSRVLKGVTRGSPDNSNRNKTCLHYGPIRGNNKKDLTNNIVKLLSQQKTATRKSKRKSTLERAREADRDSKLRV
jgi:hypothetical protein